MGEYSKTLEYYTKSLDMKKSVYGSEATHVPEVITNCWNSIKPHTTSQSVWR